jgi:multiple sugar transport system permease protein
MSALAARTKKKHSSSYNRLQRREAITGYIFILPIILGFIIFLLGPILYSLAMSFTDWSLSTDTNFIGFGNYQKAFGGDKVFTLSLLNTLKFTAFMAPLKVILGLLLAVLLLNKVRGTHIFRTILFTPQVTTLIVWVVVWRLIFATDNGLLNIFLSKLGIEGPNWLYNKNYAMPVVIFVSLLKTLGINMVLFLSALQDIPTTYGEAALIDGANGWQIFRKITLPMLSPTIFMVTIMSFMASLKVFATIYAMTNGGPARSTYVLVFYLYQQAFGAYKFGYASAIAFVLFLLIMAVTVLQWGLRKRWVYYEN